MDQKEYVAFIFARGGSKGLPGKNIKLFNGKPLLGLTIEHAKQVRRIRRVVVSTDSESIAEVALRFGAEVPCLRPEELATDDSPEWLSWRHAIQLIKKQEGILPAAIVSVPTTSPLRYPADIENCLNKYEEGEADIVIAVTDARRSPYFNIVQIGDDGRATLASSPSDVITRRQDAPALYDITTVAYVFNSEFVMKRRGIFEGRVKTVYIPPERAIDIDTFTDFEIAEFLYRRRR